MGGVTSEMTPKLLVAFLGLLTAVQGSQYWRPKLLGSFYLKDAAFVEAFENSLSEQGDLDKFTLYFTTFNFAAIFIHDPVYRLRSPGKLLDSIETWDGILEKLGGANTAYWPNQPVEIPQNVVKIHEGSSQCLKIIEKSHSTLRAKRATFTF